MTYCREIPQGIVPSIAGLKHEEQEEEDELRNEEQEEGEDELDERSNDEAEPAVEPAAEQLALQTITKKEQWNNLKSHDKSGIRKLVFSARTFLRIVQIEGFPDLEEICVTDSSLQDTKIFKVVQCNALTTIDIGSHCLNGKDKEREMNKVFFIDGCPHLERITVGDSSCSSFDECCINGNSIREFSYINTSFSGCETMQFTSRSMLCLLIIRHPLQNHLQLG